MHIMFRMCMLAMMIPLMRTALAADSVRQTGLPDANQQQAGGLLPSKPGWAQHGTTSDTVPPPPPGPYMSTALTPMPSEDQDMFESGYELYTGKEMANSPFFKPGSPWPDVDLLPPRRWVPKEGQDHYAPEDVFEQQQQVDTGYRRQYPQRPPWPVYSRPAYHSQPPAAPQPGDQGYPAFGTN